MIEVEEKKKRSAHNNQFNVHNVDQLMLKYTDYCWASI